MSTPALSPLQLLLGSAASASGGVTGPASTLVQAPQSTPDNALTEQMTNLSLPYGEQLFAPLPDQAFYSDYISTSVPTDLNDPYNLLAANQMAVAPVTGPFGGATTTILGMDPTTLAIAAVLGWWLLSAGGGGGGGRGRFR